MKIKYKIKETQNVTTSNCKVGLKVKRGPDWRWGGQDSSGIGEIENTHKSVPYYEGDYDSDLGGKVFWTSVRWKGASSNNYRVSYDNETQRDLIIVN